VESKLGVRREAHPTIPRTSSHRSVFVDGALRPVGGTEEVFELRQLDGQVAVITGASSGIGAATARSFAAEGSTLALLDIAPIPADLASLDAVSTHTVDVTDSDSVKNAMAAVADRHGRLDIVVSAAGILDAVPFLELTPERFDKTLAVDLRGVFLAARWAAPYMAEVGKGRIINIASALGIMGGTNLAHYVAAKAGVSVSLRRSRWSSHRAAFWSTRSPPARSRLHSSRACPSNGGRTRPLSCRWAGSAGPRKWRRRHCCWRAPPMAISMSARRSDPTAET
jgi:NADP-dependent 3-hydroxy acid dehydrogenase YdfG